MVTIVVLAFIRWVMFQTPARVARTQATLMMFPLASSNYFSTFGKWPQSLADFTSNPSNILFPKFFAVEVIFCSVVLILLSPALHTSRISPKESTIHPS